MCRMPYFNRSFSAKEPCNSWLFCANRPATEGIIRIFTTLYGPPWKNLLKKSSKFSLGTLQGTLSLGVHKSMCMYIVDVCVCLYIYMYICIYTYICIHIGTLSLGVGTYIYVYRYGFIHVHMYICTYAYI